MKIVSAIGSVPFAVQIIFHGPNQEVSVPIGILLTLSVIVSSVFFEHNGLLNLLQENFSQLARRESRLHPRSHHSPGHQEAVDVLVTQPIKLGNVSDTVETLPFWVSF